MFPDVSPEAPSLTGRPRQVARQLQSEFGGVYNTQNILLSATHTHSGPAGFLQYVLFQISNLGWVQESFDAQVTGIVQVRAQRRSQGGEVGRLGHCAASEKGDRGGD